MENDDVIEQLHRLQGENLAHALVLAELLRKTPHARQALREDVNWFHDQTLYSSLSDTAREACRSELQSLLREE